MVKHELEDKEGSNIDNPHATCSGSELILKGNEHSWMVLSKVEN